MTKRYAARIDGRNVQVTIPEDDRSEQAILESWPTLRAALDVLADPDADLFSAQFVKALRTVRGCLATIDAEGR